MKRIFMIILSVLIIGLSLSACKSVISATTASTTTTISTTIVTIQPDNQIAKDRQATINKLDVGILLNGYSSPQEYSTDSARLDGWFDANDYFKVFNHLSMKPGYTLDYIYHGNGSAAQPTLYARKIGSYPFTSLGQLPSSYNYLSYLQPDDTEESYFQYVAMSLMGGQFYLFWHANLNDTRVVCTNELLDNIVISNQLPAAVAKSARQINPAPEITLSNDTANVRVVTFTRWGGFKEELFTISRDPLHSFIKRDTKTLVAWNCGTTF
jgi:hypothetical protein